mmetsp:Transcript_36076/g.87668  ORF Transcript_36076/g.87668 Transcript_36076/m.87668 type:complete len:452 (+) Transcript_36076:385-1740(+)
MPIEHLAGRWGVNKVNKRAPRGSRRALEAHARRRRRRRLSAADDEDDEAEREDGGDHTQRDGEDRVAAQPLVAQLGVELLLALERGARVGRLRGDGRRGLAEAAHIASAHAEGGVGARGQSVDSARGEARLAALHRAPRGAAVDGVLHLVRVHLGGRLLRPPVLPAVGGDVRLARAGVGPRELHRRLARVACRHLLDPHVHRRVRTQRRCGEHVELRLLRAVGEVVVARGHVGVVARLELDQPKVDRGLRRVELLAVVGGLVVVVVRAAPRLLDERKLLHKRVLVARAGEGGGCVRVPLELHVEHVRLVGAERHVHARVGDLHDVVPVFVVRALAVVVAVVIGVVVARPLDVHVVRGADDQVGRGEVILGRRVRLHDVAALPLHVEVEDPSVLRDGVGAALDAEDVRAVLEGAAVLVGVDRQLEKRVRAAAVGEEAVQADCRVAVRERRRA